MRGRVRIVARRTIPKGLNHSAQCCAPALHWVNVPNHFINSEGVESFRHPFMKPRWGFDFFMVTTRRSSFLATPGWMMKSRWDFSIAPSARHHCRTTTQPKFQSLREERGRPACSVRRRAGHLAVSQHFSQTPFRETRNGATGTVALPVIHRVAPLARHPCRTTIQTKFSLCAGSAGVPPAVSGVAPDTLR